MTQSPQTKGQYEVRRILGQRRLIYAEWFVDGYDAILCVNRTIGGGGTTPEEAIDDLVRRCENEYKELVRQQRADPIEWFTQLGLK